MTSSGGIPNRYARSLARPAFAPASDANIYAAHAGMVGSSAAAMEAKLAQWQSTTVALTNKLTEHAQALTTGADEFTESDRHNAAIIAGLTPQPPRPDHAQRRPVIGHTRGS
ncbi:hypothetical protein Mycsm_06718 (plasmid) [Mycobacterium sp. JS623]|uniref:WXG100 family type VII secretion target n=1 Tax=Mycobacterium sp. JS623 TaxID=212767 RepID=UPI0002A58E68|nr:hypothetical protein [Mycobacterium sp. JS623]AGB26835.1 hypothetical protein Mycsm_06718 [Mycobacterium sp. JS623]